MQVEKVVAAVMVMGVAVAPVALVPDIYNKLLNAAITQAVAAWDFFISNCADNMLTQG